MKTVAPIPLLLFFLVLTACGGGGGSSGGVIDPPDPLIGDFILDNDNPGPNTVSMGRWTTNGALVSINVSVTDTDDIFGASFDVTYDHNLAEYASFTGGTLLEEGGHNPFYDVSEPNRGRIVVVASRTGNVPAVDVTGTEVLIRLSFTVTTTGSEAIQFENANLSNDNVPPDNLPGISWYGGTMTGTR